MGAGEEKVKQKGANGLVTETYKITKSGGKVVSKTLLSKDVYNAMQRIIIRGTGAGEETTVTPTPAPTPSTPTVKPEEPKEPETPEPKPSENTTKTDEGGTTEGEE